MTSNRWVPRALTAVEQEQAKALFEREVDLIVPGSFDDSTGEARRVRAWMARTGDRAPVDTWIGLFDGVRVVGALHAGPHYGQAADVLSSLGRPGAPDARWLRAYIELVGSIEEVAVDPAYRRQGAGAALVRVGVAGLAHRGVRTVSGFASSPASVELFRSLRFTVGGRRQAVPAAFSEGLQTSWWDGVPEDGRYFWKALPAPGAAFGLR
ncbi:GNAT family N-acetyltransferase [Actinotalea sp. K2]|uniref:GNAT family N-acetyltransferase n=1 Tax=Actinotalea sp. K2 TaxID=2939438 RepID=UPI0020171C6D|nr:GNAT family N-acetyltransferase [Actinotalea sp. K2]MCL3862984.1 GNAT family N-acetyltransferase [Actinotalea sp. K2]